MNAAYPVRIALDRDPCEEAWEQLRAECEAEFEDWQRADYDARELEDFSNWLVNKARWNGGGKYAAALNAPERRRVDLVKVAAGQRRFVRENGR